MTVKEMMTELCKELYEKDRALFIGYNVWKGSRMYGTLNQIPSEGCNETPCAENLMVGLAVGLALDGSRLPVLCFERHEFALFSLGMLAVMADKFTDVAGVRFPMIVRVVRGASKPLDPGEQHKGDYGLVFRFALKNAEFLDAGERLTHDDVMRALCRSKSGIVVILEERDGYEQTV